MEANYNNCDEKMVSVLLILKDEKKELEKQWGRLERSKSDLVRSPRPAMWGPIKTKYKECEDTIRESGQFDFDDTLKKIELALKYGLDYDLEEKKQEEPVFHKPSKPAEIKRAKKVRLCS